MGTPAGFDLKRLFEPRSLAIAGASERINWMRSVAANLVHFGFQGEVYAVNPRGADVFGYPGRTACTAIGKPVDVAMIMTPTHTVEAVLQDVIDAGIKACAILTSGFAEAGEEGKAAQARLVEMALANGVALFGPNSLGFVNVRARAALAATPLVRSLEEGRIGIVSQSGGLGAELVATAARNGVGLSFYATTGNESVVSLSDIVEYLVDDPGTKVIGVVAETIRKPEGLMRAAMRARAAGKPIAFLKVGAAALTAEVAKAHTGSMVGDDRVFNAVCEQTAMVRVDSLEDMIATVDLLEEFGPMQGQGVGFVSVSGGACTLIADQVEKNGVTAPKLAPETVTALREVIPFYASTLNPVDITGGIRPDIFTNSIRIVAADPSICRVVSILDLPSEPGGETLSPLHRAVGEGLTAISPRGVHLISAAREMTPQLKAFLKEAGIPKVLSGIALGMRALGRVSWWSRKMQEQASGRSFAPPAAAGVRPTSERETIDYLKSRGVGVIPQVLASDRAAAVAAAKGMDGPVALKLASPDVAHKTEIGGVKLGLEGEEAVGRAFDEIVGACRTAVPGARIEGVLVSPMRRSGLELFVGVARDPQWGPVIAVGLGGVLVEVLSDTALSLLPVAPSDVRAMLERLQGARLLKGFRGAAAIDLDRLSEEIARIGDAALALGPDLAALEINPLLADGGRIEALDALAVWTDRPAGKAMEAA